MHSSVRVVNHFFAKRDEQLREDKKIRANIFKNKIKNLNVWLVGREKCAIGFVKNLPTKCGGIVKTKNSFELGFCLQMARNGQNSTLAATKMP